MSLLAMMAVQRRSLLEERRAEKRDDRGIAFSSSRGSIHREFRGFFETRRRTRAFSPRRTADGTTFRAPRANR